MQGQQGWRRGLVAALATFALMGGGLVGVGAAHAAPLTVEATAGVVGGAAKLKISSQPKSRTVAAGKTAKFTVKVPRGAKVTWQVRKPGSKKYVTVKGATRTTLSVRATTKLDGARYRAKVVKGKARATSSSARLTVVTKPRFTTQPTSAFAAMGTTVTFRARAVGGALTYTWYRTRVGDSRPRPVATGRTLAVKVTKETAGARYAVRVVNAAGHRSSRAVRLVADVAPAITRQPSDVAATAQDSVTLSVGASGPNLRYAWQALADDAKTWRTVASTTTSTYQMATRTSMNYGQMRVVVSNTRGSVTSRAFSLFVWSTESDPAEVGGIVNLEGWDLSIDAFDRSLATSEEIESIFGPAGNDGMGWAMFDVTAVNVSGRVLDPLSTISVWTQPWGGVAATGFIVRIDGEGGVAPGKAADLFVVVEFMQVGEIARFVDTSSEIVAGFVAAPPV